MSSLLDHPLLITFRKFQGEELSSAVKTHVEEDPSLDSLRQALRDYFVGCIPQYVKLRAWMEIASHLGDSWVNDQLWRIVSDIGGRSNDLGGFPRLESACAAFINILKNHPPSDISIFDIQVAFQSLEAGFFKHLRPPLKEPELGSLVNDALDEFQSYADKQNKKIIDGTWTSFRECYSQSRLHQHGCRYY